VSGALRPSPQPPLVASIHAALPQTQCTRCGYPDCASYAEAIAIDGVPINQCPPGGAAGISRLAALTGQPIIPLNPAHGLESPRSVAVIDEVWCIGCTLCLEVCPTDAIIGSNKSMHTVIEPHCTGCELCIPVCPVDCIILENVTGERSGWSAWSRAQADSAWSRYQTHQLRRQIRSGSQSAEPTASPALGAAPQQAVADHDADARKREVIESALARARAVRTAKPWGSEESS
jgi:Na+-translocating ferredoxin:NAD+ oxidoreductase subunit B